MKDRVYDNYMINWAENQERLADLEQLHSDEVDDVLEEAKDKEEEEAEDADKKLSKEEETVVDIETEQKEEARDLHILVNESPIVMKNKAEYILVDVLDYYPFDLSQMGGSELVTMINDVPSTFTDILHENDVVRIFWKD